MNYNHRLDNGPFSIYRFSMFINKQVTLNLNPLHIYKFAKFVHIQSGGKNIFFA